MLSVLKSQNNVIKQFFDHIITSKLNLRMDLSTKIELHVELAMFSCEKQ